MEGIQCVKKRLRLAVELYRGLSDDKVKSQTGLLSIGAGWLLHDQGSDQHCLPVNFQSPSAHQPFNSVAVISNYMLF